MMQKMSPQSSVRLNQTLSGDNVVRLSYIPRNVSLEMIKTFLENVGAGPIYDIWYTDKHSALVYFQLANGRFDVNSRLFIPARRRHAGINKCRMPLFLKYAIGSEIFSFTMGFHEELCITGVVAVYSSSQFVDAWASSVQELYSAHHRT